MKSQLSIFNVFYRRPEMFGVVVFILFSCQSKQESTENQKAVDQEGKQIFFITYDTDPEAQKWFEYDLNGDLIRQAMSVDTIVFEYADRKIIKRHLDKKLSWLSKVVYTTDQKGIITSSNIFDEDDKEISQYKFEYNREGYLVKTIQDVTTSKATYINEFIYENGDLKEVLAYNKDGQYISKYAFEYNSDMHNVFNMSFHQMIDDIFPNERLGKMNKNMLKQMANISKDGDTLSLLKFRYDPVTNGKLKEYQSDVLNEFETELIYHFVSKK